MGRRSHDDSEHRGMFWICFATIFFVKSQQKLDILFKALYGLTTWSVAAWYKAQTEVFYPCFLTVASLFDSNHFLLWYENTSDTD